VHGLTPRGLGAVNAAVLARVSHELNTFPSGHVAVALAAAGCVLSVSAAAGGVFTVVALAIALGAVAGRYHYLADVLLGGVMAIAALALVM
jgi:membrane-associated phospholipid phosphatase